MSRACCYALRPLLIGVFVVATAGIASAAEGINVYGSIGSASTDGENTGAAGFGAEWGREGSDDITVTFGAEYISFLKEYAYGVVSSGYISRSVERRTAMGLLGFRYGKPRGPSLRLRAGWALVSNVETYDEVAVGRSRFIDFTDSGALSVGVGLPLLKSEKIAFDTEANMTVVGGSHGFNAYSLRAGLTF